MDSDREHFKERDRMLEDLDETLRALGAAAAGIDNRIAEELYWLAGKFRRWRERGEAGPSPATRNVERWDGVTR